MSDIFPLDLTEGCKSLPNNERRPPLHQHCGVKAKRNNFSYSKSLSLGHNDIRTLPRNFNSFSSAILFKDSRGLPAVQPLQSTESCPGIEDNILNFFKCYKCYDLIPTSAKLVVIDTQLVLKKAFFAIVETGVRSCPLWDSERQTYVGMLTITDFIRIIQKNYKGSLIEIQLLEEQKLMDWEGLKDSKDLVYVSPDASLYEAVSLLIENKIHRLPIIDQSNGNVLYILNQKPLLRFLLHHVPNLENFHNLRASISEADVGTFEDIQVATESTTIIEAVTLLVKKDISALPIVDEKGRLINIYTKFDAINLAATKTYTDLEVNLKEATEHKTTYWEGVQTCKADDSVLAVMEKLVKAEVHRLVVVDEDDGVVGIVTVSDILNYLVISSGQTKTLARPTRHRQRREDSIGEEVELEEEEEENMSNKVSLSCSPPHWFTV